jgi:hypothetical protein
MKSWFTSMNGAVTLSVIALVTELWRAFVDFQREYSTFLDSTGALLLGTFMTVPMMFKPQRTMTLYLIFPPAIIIRNCLKNTTSFCFTQKNKLRVTRS